MKKIYIYWIFFQSDDRNKKYENILTKKIKMIKKKYNMTVIKCEKYLYKIMILKKK